MFKEDGVLKGSEARGREVIAKCDIRVGNMGVRWQSTVSPRMSHACPPSWASPLPAKVKSPIAS